MAFFAQRALTLVPLRESMSIMENKICSRCRESKPASEYYQRSPGGHTLHSACKQCERKMAREWYARNKEAAKYKYREWREKNADRILEYRIRNKARDYRRACARKYGVPVSWVDEQMERQHGCCAICSLRFGWNSKQTTPHVDHDHATGCVRALLCNRCNSVLGLVADSVETLYAMGRYLCHGYSAKH